MTPIEIIGLLRPLSADNVHGQTARTVRTPERIRLQNQQVLSDMTLSAVMRRMQEDEVKAGGKGWVDARSGRPAVPHGLRSTFRDWAAERTTYPREMAEMALAHHVGSEVERAYRRTDMLGRRREMMDDWARFLGV